MTAGDIIDCILAAIFVYYGLKCIKEMLTSGKEYLYGKDDSSIGNKSKRL